jgi:hypothetical protein
MVVYRIFSFLEGDKQQKGEKNPQPAESSTNDMDQKHRLGASIKIPKPSQLLLLVIALRPEVSQTGVMLHFPYGFLYVASCCTRSARILVIFIDDDFPPLSI